MRTTELVRFAVGGLWRQKVRTILTLVGVAVGTSALAFSLALGFGLRAFIDREFKERPGFWRVNVRVSEPAPDASAVPAEKVVVQGKMSEERKARIREVLVELHVNGLPRKPPVLLTPETVAKIAALPDVAEVRTYRTGEGRVWLGDRAAPGFTVAGRLAGLDDRLVAGRLPASDDAAEVLVSEFVLYELGVRDDADLEAAVGKPVQLDVGGMQNAQPMSLARALLGRVPKGELTRNQARALEKLAAALPGAIDSFDLTPGERAGLKALLEKKPEPEAARPWESGAVATGQFRIAGVVRVTTAEERKRVDPFSPWELMTAGVLLPPGSGEALFTRLPWARETGFHSAEVRVKPGGDLPGTVKAIEDMGYGTFSSLKWFTNVKREVTLFAGGINLFSLVALFVAGLGITNTLVTSVVERTREIGILKAVGATRGQVLGIFLLEGTAIGAVGAAVGLALARAAAVPAEGWLMREMEQQAHGEKFLSESVFVFPWWLFAGSLAFAVLLTTAAAYYPARRAARIQPIEALKYE